MFIEICSNNHVSNVGKGDSAVYADIRYWVDDNNVYWYAYDDVCKLVQIDDSMSNVWYTRDIPENQKCTCMDSNNYNNYNEKIKAPVNFITSETARVIVQQHKEYITERDNNIIKIFNNLECVGYAYELYHDAEEIKERKYKIYESIEHDDYEELFYQCYKISQTESSRDVLHKRNIINKDLEEAVDKIRDYMYKDEINTIVLEGDDSLIKLFKEEDKWTFDNWFNNNDKED